MAFVKREQKVISLTEDSERIAAEIDYHAVLRKEISPKLPGAPELALRGVSACEFSHGKIVRLADYC